MWRVLKRKVHVVARQQQRQNEANLYNDDDNEKSKSSEKKKEVVQVAKDVKGTSNRVSNKKEKLEEQHQLDIERETDEKFFRRVSRERESTPLTAGILLKIPRNRYVDAGLPADVKEAEKHVPKCWCISDGKLSSGGLRKCKGVKGWQNC